MILTGWLGADADPERMRRLSDEKEARFRALVRAHGIEPLPGVREWVARLQSEGWLQAIATSAPRLNLETMVDAMQMRPFFGATVAARGRDATASPTPRSFSWPLRVSAPSRVVRSWSRTPPLASRRGDGRA